METEWGERMAEVETVPAKQLIFRVKRPGDWFGNDYNMNIYRGCSHGCIYCDSRSACYGDPAFDTIKVKEDALRIIRDDLRRKVKTGVIGTGAMSDPYNPLEEELLLTRHALELLSAYGFGVSIATKGSLVARDGDVLREIASHSPVLVKITVTTMDEALCKIIEPHAPSPSARMEAIKKLSEQGVYCGILMMPLLPFLTDTPENIQEVAEAAKEAGARFIYPSLGMTLRQGNREYYYQVLEQHFPGLRERYQRAYGDRYVCSSPKAKALWQIFTQACSQRGLLWEMKDIIRDYRMGYDYQQLGLF